MRKFAILAAVIMVTMTLPMAMASHLSVGAMTTAGMSPDETPNDPSVVGETKNDPNTPYGVGTSTDCYDADAEISADEPAEAASAREVCGDLLYNKGTPELTRPSPPDQDIPDGSPIGLFDVQVGKSTIAAALWRTCLPFCTPIAGDASWTALHTVGDAAGLMKGPEESSQEDGSPRYQIITNDVSRPNSMTLVQRQTGMWEMNGWYGVPGHAERVIAFIEDKQGNPFTGSDLNQYVDALMGADAKAQLCGFSADTTLSSSKDLTDCQVKLYYQGPGDDGAADTTFDGYDDKCNSPTYVCAAQGPYWRSRNVGFLGPFSGSFTQTDVFAWHWALGYTPHECPNVEPMRLAFPNDVDDGLAYLAHDLDVYTTASDTALGGPETSTDGTVSYANTLADSQDVTIPGLPGPVQDAIDDAEDAVDTASEPVVKDDALEPNSADTGLEISDNSRGPIDETRLDPTACASITDSETSQTRDPWVNVIDAQVDGVHDDALAADLDLYGNSDNTHDGSNRAGPSLYATEGKIGVFADKNDDGDYDQVGSEPWQSKRIQNTGAYPMMWDMNVNADKPEDPENSGGGCPGPGGGFSGAMADAGYGPETALVQAIYLREPTMFVNIDASTTQQRVQTAPYPGGNNIYVLSNNAAKALWDGDTTQTTDNDVDRLVDNLVDDLGDLVIDKYGADAGSLDVYEPGDELGLGSDFTDQCGQPTGGFDSDLSFTHYCRGPGAASCRGDTIATMYTFDVVGNEEFSNTLGGGSGEVPPLTVNGGVYEFGSGQHTWYDLDPLDNDPDRNDPSNPPAN